MSNHDRSNHDRRIISENPGVYIAMKSAVSLALLYLVDLFISKLKTKFNNLFLYRMILNTKRIHNSF